MGPLGRLLGTATPLDLKLLCGIHWQELEDLYTGDDVHARDPERESVGALANARLEEGCAEHEDAILGLATTQLGLIVGVPGLALVELSPGLKMVCAREARVVTEWMRRTDTWSLPRAER